MSCSEWVLAVARTGDPCFGLFVAGFVSPMTFHALGFSIAASSTLAEALARAVRYHSPWSRRRETPSR